MSELFCATIMQQTLPPQSYAENIDGDPVDLNGTDVRGFAALLLGQLGVGTTLAARIQESHDLVTFVDVPGATFPTFTTGVRSELLGFTRTRRYVRMRVDLSGTADLCAAIGHRPPTPAPVPVNFVANLIASRDNLSAIILAQTNAWIADGCPPSFSVDGESYSWNEWFDGKAAGIDTLSKSIQNNAPPFAVKSRVRA